MLIEEQLQDGRTWLFNTIAPGRGDVGTHYIVRWIQTGMTLGAPLFEGGVFPGVVAWMARMQTYLDERKDNGNCKPSTISGDDAATLLSALPDDTLENVGFDTKETAQLDLSQVTRTAVVDADVPGDVPTVGKLVGLTEQEVVLEMAGMTAAIHCHFPRLGFKVYAGPQQDGV